MVLACAQFRPRFGDTRGNLARIASLSENARADLVVFPELAVSGYEFRGRAEAQELALDVRRGAEMRRLRELSGDLKSCLVVGFPERSRDRVFNSAALVEPSGRVTVYRKVHLFDREKERFDAGTAPWPVVDIGIGRVGLMICFDWIFPEAARSLALRGAQLIAHPSNLVLELCQRAMFARSVENRVFTATCNRVGTERRDGRTVTFTGSSQILDPRGRVVAQADARAEQVIRAEIEPAAADDKMVTPHNDVWADRRPRLYAALVRSRSKGK